MKNSEKGSVLVEMMFAVVLLLFMAFATVEVTKMLSFKNKLYTVAVELTQQISQQHLYLMELSELYGDETVNKWITNKLEEMSTNYFSALEKTSYRIGLTPNLKWKKTGTDSGVYIQLSACYSFTFLPSLKKVISDEKASWGKFKKSIEANPIQLTAIAMTRNCLGQYSQQPNSQVKLVERAYAPWPASTVLYNYGLSSPETIELISNAQRRIRMSFQSDPMLQELYER